MAYKNDTVAWLLQNAGPIIRYRTFKEYPWTAHKSELKDTARQVFAHPEVKIWLERLSPQSHRHSSHNIALENVMWKLSEYGCDSSMPAFDRKMAQFLQRLPTADVWQHADPFGEEWLRGDTTVFAYNLLRTGYGNDKRLRQYLSNYIKALHPIARDRVYDFFLDASKVSALPNVCQGKRIMKQEITASYYLVNIRDIHMLSALPVELTKKFAPEIDDIIGYVLDKRLQSLQPGGYYWHPQRKRCYAWGPHFPLPGYHNLNFSSFEKGVLLLHLEAFAPFAAARKTKWFQNCLDYVEQFRTTEGTYRLPRLFLREEKSGYYCQGYYMGLGEDRKNRIALEIESTYRMLRIKRLAGES